jgi:hypothetical protein
VLTVREECGLRVFENRELGPRRDEVTREWRNLHYEKLNDLYCSPGYQIEKNEMGRKSSMYGGEEKCILNFGRKT